MQAHSHGDFTWLRGWFLEAITIAALFAGSGTIAARHLHDSRVNAPGFLLPMVAMISDSGSSSTPNFCRYFFATSLRNPAMPLLTL